MLLCNLVPVYNFGSMPLKEALFIDVKVILEKDEDGYFVATVPSLPGCISQGKN